MLFVDKIGEQQQRVRKQRHAKQKSDGLVGSDTGQERLDQGQLLGLGDGAEFCLLLVPGDPVHEIGGLENRVASGRQDDDKGGA